MDRDFRRGYLEIDFPTEPFASPLPLLRDSIRVFFANLPFLAAATLVIYLPGKLATQFLCYLLDIPFEGVLSYFFLLISDLLLSAWWSRRLSTGSSSASAKADGPAGRVPCAGGGGSG